MISQPDTKMWALDFEQARIQPCDMTHLFSDDEKRSLYLDWLDYRDFCRTREYLIGKLSRFCHQKITKETCKEISNYLSNELPKEIDKEYQSFLDAISLKNISFKL